MLKFAGLILIVLFVISLFPSSGPRITKRFTVEVATPQGIRTGSSVISSQSSKAPWWFPAFGASSQRIRGEAVAVDLGGGRMLFVPLDPVTMIPSAVDHTGTSLKDYFRPNLVGQDGLVADLKYLNVVTFEHMSDPASARRVDPLDLGAVFGPGYSLRSLRVKDTSDPVTLPNTARFKTLFDSVRDGYAFTQPL